MIFKNEIIENKKRRFAFLDFSKYGTPDYWILTIYFCLICFSIILIYSSSYNFSLKTFKDPYYLFNKHIIGVVIGICFLFIGFIFPLEKLRKHLPIISFLTLVLLTLPLIPGISTSIAGTNRWISFGAFQFQPSEVAKMIIVLYLAHQLTKNKSLSPFEFSKENSAILLFSGICAILILIQKDFSTSTIFLITVLMILYITGISSKNLTHLFLIVLILLVPFILFTPYRLDRIEMFFNLSNNPSNAYQITQSLAAFHKGGFFGLGPGEKQAVIPYIFNDFIFAAAGEELGFLGCIFILILFFLLLKRGLKISKKLFANGDSYGSIIIFGFTINIVFQAFTNIAVNLALIFPTGIPLPFVSYGRTSFIVSSFCVGVILKYSQKT